MEKGDAFKQCLERKESVFELYFAKHVEVIAHVNNDIAMYPKK